MKVRELLEGNVIEFPTKKSNKNSIELSLDDTFSSGGYSFVKKVLGKTFSEKPDYFGSVKEITALEFKKLQNALKKNNYPDFKEYPAEKIFGEKGAKDDDVPGFGTSSSPKWMPDETTFVIKFGNGNRYLVDKTGARTYIRMWLKIKEA